MTQNVPGLIHGQPAPTQFFTATQELLSSYVSPNFALKANTATQIGIAAGTGTDQVSASIDGRYRFITAAITRTVSGAAGTYDVFITASNNVMADPDTTNYSFALAVVATGGTPAGVDVYLKIGVLTWDGVGITRVFQTVGVRQRAATWERLLRGRIMWPAANGISPRYFDGLGGTGVTLAWTPTLPPPELFGYSAADDPPGLTAIYRFLVKWLFNTNPRAASNSWNFGLVRLPSPLTVNTSGQINLPSVSAGAPYVIGGSSLNYPTQNGNVGTGSFAGSFAPVDGAVYAPVATPPGALDANSFAAFELEFQRCYV